MHAPSIPSSIVLTSSSNSLTKFAADSTSSFSR
uniref:Uncharacterized protein n=1 Tax=Arundo donax TaxID=35708 RepID=A0A0A9CQ37_ARUDO